MGNPYPANFEALDGSRRLTGQVDFTDAGNQPGSAQPVTMELGADLADISGQNFYPFKWDAAWDNPANPQPIVAVPVGLGLAVAFDGSSEAITTTEVGVWALTLTVSVPPDASWFGVVELDPNDADPGQLMPTLAAGASNRATISETVMYPAGVVIAPTIITVSNATAGSLTCSSLLVIVRLA